MADCDGFPLFASAAHCQLQLLAHGRDFSDIVKEWNVSKGGANPEAPCGIKGYRRRCGPAVYIEETPVTQHRHEFVHELGIRGSLRTLMIVDAHNTGDILQELLDEGAHLGCRHARAQFLRFGRFTRRLVPARLAHEYSDQSI